MKGDNDQSPDQQVCGIWKAMSGSVYRKQYRGFGMYLRCPRETVTQDII
jgi:hypothetical protein